MIMYFPVLDCATASVLCIGGECSLWCVTTYDACGPVTLVALSQLVMAICNRGQMMAIKTVNNKTECASRLDNRCRREQRIWHSVEGMQCMCIQVDGGGGATCIFRTGWVNG
mmetsp:Transcript_99804/g.172028  ORF Transcript_99804/g.172028 Transcript_99804/m.172028 type:complete len:112 (-) Transcript_99804:2308-2643(-)